MTHLVYFHQYCSLIIDDPERLFDDISLSDQGLQLPLTPATSNENNISRSGQQPVEIATVSNEAIVARSS